MLWHIFCVDESMTTLHCTKRPDSDAAEVKDAASAWQARLRMQFTHTVLRERSKTVLSKLAHEGPLRVQRPFYPESDAADGVCHVYMLHPPGGVAGGDALEINVLAQRGAQALLTTPGSTKFYRSIGRTAQVTQTITVEAGAAVEWLPQENIYFPGTMVQAQTRVQLVDDAAFIGWDIQSLGRPANEEVFGTGAIASMFTLERDGVPLLREAFRVSTSAESLGDLHSVSGMRGYPMSGMFIATHCNEALLHACRERLTAVIAAQPELDCPYGLTLLNDVLVLRVLGHRTERMQKLMVPVWQLVRPAALGREAVAPRIWAT